MQKSPESKQCSKCKEWKPISEFYKNNRSKDKLDYKCKQCACLLSKRYRINNKEEISKRRKEYRINNKEKITKQKHESYLRYKEYILKQHHEYYAKHKDEHKERGRKYRRNNKEKLEKAAKKWRKNNINRVRKYYRNYMRAKRKDSKFRLNSNISRVLSMCLNGEKNGQKTWDLLDYTPKQLRKQLKKQFQSGMTWKNYGEWHLDHIIPIDAFNFESPDDIDFKKCWALENLQPLWASENCSKRDNLLKPFQPSLLLRRANG